MKRAPVPGKGGERANRGPQCADGRTLSAIAARQAPALALTRVTILHLKELDVLVASGGGQGSGLNHIRGLLFECRGRC
jgi:hypothetical protein